ncbi:hypothetical protein BDB01DRAFT_831578 [Pilobolus umbonatus]|nr:hypothetical protein BDB01DRAFT_831578 [Pilobolus umbonatus]
MVSIEEGSSQGRILKLANEEDSSYRSEHQGFSHIEQTPLGAGIRYTSHTAFFYIYTHANAKEITTVGYYDYQHHEGADPCELSPQWQDQSWRKSFSMLHCSQSVLIARFDFIINYSIIWTSATSAANLLRKMLIISYLLPEHRSSSNNDNLST